MKTREDSQSFSLISRVLVATTMFLVCLIALLSYKLLAQNQTIQSQSSAKSFELAQLVADVRTIAAAISYVLEPEPTTPSSPVSPNAVNAPQFLLGQASPRSSGFSNQSTLSRTNHPPAG
jgi:hypothetical protein